VVLVICPAEPDETVVKAKVENIGEDVDVALLKAAPVPGITPLELTSDNSIALTDEVTAFGFPLGQKLALDRYPNVRATQGKISALRKLGGRLAVVEFDARIEPGNSGGPLLDHGARVVGAVTASVMARYFDRFGRFDITLPTGINRALPPSAMAGFLRAPRVVFDPAAIAYADRAKPVDLRIKLVPTSLSGIEGDRRVRLILSTGPGDERTHEVPVAGDGEYRTRVIPVTPESEWFSVLAARFKEVLPPSPDASPRVQTDGRAARRPVAFLDERTQKLWQSQDLEVRVGEVTASLSGLAYFEARPSPRAITTDGRILEGRLSLVGGARPAQRLDPSLVEEVSRADAVVVRRRQPPELAATVEVSRKGDVLIRATRRIRMTGMVGAPTAGQLDARRLLPQPSLEDDRSVDARGLFDPAAWGPRAAARGIRPPAVAMASVKPRAERRAEGVLQEIRYPDNTPCRAVAMTADGSTFAASLIGRIHMVGKVGSGYLGSGPSGGLALSKDGHRLLLGRIAERTVEYWEPSKNKEIWRLQGHTDAVTRVALGADGRIGVSGSKDRTVRVWDLVRGRELRVLNGHDGPVTGVALLPDGRQAVSSAEDGTIRVWDLEPGAEARRFGTGFGPIRCLAVSARGQIAASGHDDGVVRVWDIENGRLLASLIGHADRVNALAIAADDLVVSAAGAKDGTIRVWSIETGRELRKLRTSPVLDLAVSADGQSLIAGDEAGSAKHWSISLEPDEGSAETGDGTPLIRPVRGTISGMTFGGGGRYMVLTLNGQRRLDIFDVNSAEVVGSIPLPTEEVLVAAGADTHFLVLAGQCILQRWDLAAGRRFSETRLPFRGRLTSLALGADANGPLLAFWEPEGQAPPDARFSRLAQFCLLDPSSARPMTVLSYRLAHTVFSQDLPGPSALLPIPWWNQHELPILPSADGSLFLVGGSAIALERQQVQMWGVPGGGPIMAFPSADGQKVICPEGQVFDRLGRRLSRDVAGLTRQDVMTIPAVDSPFRLDIVLPAPSRPLELSLCELGGEKLVSTVALPEMDDLYVDVSKADAGHERRPGGPLPKGAYAVLNPRVDPLLTRRFQLVASAKLLITIPRSNDRLVLRRLDVAAAVRSHARATSPSIARANTPSAPVPTGGMPAAPVAMLTPAVKPSPPDPKGPSSVPTGGPRRDAPSPAPVTSAPNLQLSEDSSDRYILGLLVLAGVAVVGYLLQGSVRLTRARSRPASALQLQAPRPSLGWTALSIIRQTIAVACLITITGLAIHEWKVYRDFAAASRWIDARLYDRTRTPATRSEVEAIFGRHPDRERRLVRGIEARYSWDGLLRTHGVTLIYDADKEQHLRAISGP
jgi:WD40 repeat protein